jgi:hypothetical protein
MFEIAVLGVRSIHFETDLKGARGEVATRSYIIARERLDGAVLTATVSLTPRRRSE